MRDKPLNCYVRLAMHDEIRNHWSITRAIWDYELIYIDEGQMNVEVGRNHFIAKKGDIVFLTPGIVHTLSNKKGILTQPHVHFDLFYKQDSEDIGISFLVPSKMSDEQKKLFRKDNLEEYGLNIPPVLHLYNAKTIKDILFEIIDEFHLNNTYRDEYISSLMNEILVLVSRGYQTFKTGGNYKSPSKFLTLDKFILNNMERNPSLSELAAVMNISEPHFSVIFKNHYGVSPHAYISKLRINRAGEMVLHYQHLSIKDISQILNFDSVQSFSKWFRKYYRVSPRDYRLHRGDTTNSNN